MDCARYQLGLLNIAPEIRANILAFAITWDKYHVLDDGMVECAKEASDEWCTSLYECHGHAHKWRADCRRCTNKTTPALLLTCRLLRKEAFQLIQERQSVICDSSASMLRFLLHQPMARNLGGQVVLACGSAKHGSDQQNRATIQVLQILATCNPGVRGLHLVVHPYYGIYDDTVILRRPLLVALSRFRELKQFTLSMIAAPPGPLSIDMSSKVRKTMLAKKVFRTQAALSQLICTSHSQKTDRNITDFLHSLRTALCSSEQPLSG